MTKNNQNQKKIKIFWLKTLINSKLGIILILNQVHQLLEKKLLNFCLKLHHLWRQLKFKCLCS